MTSSIEVFIQTKKLLEIGMGLTSQQPITRAEQLMEVVLMRDPHCAGTLSVEINYILFGNENMYRKQGWQITIKEL